MLLKKSNLLIWRIKMNEIMNLSRKFPSQNSVQIQKLELNDADLVDMKDMKTLIKDTKRYLENIRKGTTHG